ncbi:hypothetical protein WR25_06179 [Diploscapter pachys]|uniref:SEA domain-containing protein n=1 Tax=Diploscapter pachys TaxID=2018661 RepID=A0A2A2LSF2_9BILA|nr:hypothetical protein WR25_06179 [Diploscapter pachys]
MGVPIFAALTLTYIYHATLNLPDLPYSHDLRRAGSEEFRKTARSLSTAIYDLIGDLPGEHRIAVNEFRYHQVLGTLVYLDIYAEKHNHEVHQRLHEAVENGKIGNFTLSNEGFVFRVVRGSFHLILLSKHEIYRDFC